MLCQKLTFYAIARKKPGKTELRSISGLPYETLGTSVLERQTAYRELFRYELEPGQIDAVRAATNGNFVLGDARFQAQVANVLGKRVAPGVSGRPRKVEEPVNGVCFSENRGLTPVFVFVTPVFRDPDPGFLAGFPPALDCVMIHRRGWGGCAVAVNRKKRRIRWASQ